MEKVTSAKLAEILGCTQKTAPAEISNVSTDSRKVDVHTLFIALKGERFDAHDFVKDVINAGCPLAVVNHRIDGVAPEHLLIVDDTLKAYGRIGAYNRSLFKGTVIGLTGSAGKTTTKEEIAFLLSKFGKTYATSGNHNNFVGVPQSLCEMDMSAEYAVIEMGMSAKGEISYLTDLVRPDIAVVTNVYPMHIEFFDNFEGIAYAKAEIFEGLQKKGTAIINNDTNFADVLEKQARLKTDKILKFGKKIHPTDNFATQENGEQYLYNAWCALSVVQALGLDVEKAASYVKDFGALDGRGKHHTLTLGTDNTYTLIDDSYSGQPEAMIMAVQNLDKLPTKGRKIALLGKMAELGSTSPARHREIGKVLAQSDIDIVIGVCPEMRDMLAELPPQKIQFYFENKDGVADFLLNKLLQNDDTILIKGARYSSKMYQVAEELIKKGEQR
ncbi:MAG: UDP-N-acetylmuramoyl-tripeptide--D-alanyl-D-alanine ligase [Alphaproteobacteria bacterium]|nr:UDP-N-acetylmuramoyl-tripeptide--D-alanyl-D-alanine ligase [Alphaproteobacteria bacterium]